MRIIQLLPTLSYGDGVGNDTIAIDKIIKELGYDTMIYAENIDPRVDQKLVKRVDKMPQLHKEDIIIYHLSTGTILNEKLKQYPLIFEVYEIGFKTVDFGTQGVFLPDKIPAVEALTAALLENADGISALGYAACGQHSTAVGYGYGGIRDEHRSPFHPVKTDKELAVFELFNSLNGVTAHVGEK